MPLAGVAVAIGMTLGGETPQAALLLFVVAGVMLPLLVYVATKQLWTDDKLALMASLLTMVLPDVVWNSLRTDSTILNMVLMMGAVITLNHGLRRQRWWAFVASGVCAGLAYLTRNDSIVFLPMLLVLSVAYVLFGRRIVSVRVLLVSLGLVPLAFVATISPWLMRNQQVLGMLGTPEGSRMFFMVDQRDHYAYGIDLTLETMLERQTIQEHMTKRLFELGAGVKQMAVSLDVLLTVAVPIGLIVLLWRRDWHRLLLVAPAVIWIAGILVAYPILMPLKSQSGSFEKAFLTMLPLLIPLGVFGLTTVIKNHKLQWGIILCATVWLMANSIHTVQRETDFANTYYASIQKLIDTLDTLPDVTGDGEVRLMAQDPYVISYFGYKSVMMPFATREDTLLLADRYAIDYIMMPPGRPALDALYLQQETDPRFALVAHIADAGVKPFELYQFVHADD
jgi:4-amino-4-deoxy-L-arabinose transferase-like glycosyltransferase